MKQCRKCRSIKPLDEFYAHPRTADGRLASCKECCRLYAKANRRAKAAYYKRRDLERAKLPERRLALSDMQKVRRFRKRAVPSLK